MTGHRKINHFHLEYTRYFGSANVRLHLTLFKFVCLYYMLLYNERSIQIRRCSVVVITPDFDVHLSKLSGNRSSTLRRALFFRFGLCSDYFLVLISSGRREFQIVNTTWFAFSWVYDGGGLAHLSMLLSQWQIVYLRAQTTVIQTPSDV